MQPLIRAEYLDVAIEKSAHPSQVAELESVKRQAVVLGALEASTLQRCVINRIRAGEKRSRIGAPASIKTATAGATEEIHRYTLNACREAKAPSEIIESLLALVRNDIELNQTHIDLPENQMLSEELLAQKVGLAARFELFLSHW